MNGKVIDTHCHLYLEDFDPEQDQLIRQALDSGIARLLLPNVDCDTVDRLHGLCDRYPDYLFPMMGLHPTAVQLDYASRLLKIERLLPLRKYCAIGEIGIDLYWDKSRLKEQKQAFVEQLQWSIDMDLPVVVHCRDAFGEVIDCLCKVDSTRLWGVFHSFTGTVDELEELKKWPRFKIGINGVVTFKNAHLDQTLQHTSIRHIVLETDAPYLSPVPYRGKRNEPAYIWKTAAKVADIYGLSLEEVAAETTKNAAEIFHTLP